MDRLLLTMITWHLINVMVFIQSHMVVTDSTHTIVSPRLRWSAAMDSNTDAKVEV